MSAPRVPSPADPDSEHTAELPVLDPAAQAAAGELHQSQTDTWIAPPLAGGPAEARQNDTLILPPLAG
ncbi:MAG TPA: hypothetical protein VMO54_07705, partial [Steroidobacteraceae bacterium]|nr:hypothetical protein [Steroidobacteraceae bacterium]